MHHKNVDPGVFENIYADSDLNGDHKSQRMVCTLVPLGYNSYGDPDLCEMKTVRTCPLGSGFKCRDLPVTAPQAIIQTAPSGALGRFSLKSMVKFSLPGHIHIWAHNCVVFCWDDRVCNAGLKDSVAERPNHSNL